MIEDYYDIITKIENFVDGLMIVDDKGVIKYNKQFANSISSFDEENAIGKRPMDVWINLTEETSTCYRALKYGETTVNKVQKLKYNTGEEFLILDNTFPITEGDKIIGAVSTSKFIDNISQVNTIDLSNMTSTYKDDLSKISDIIGNSKEIQTLKYKIHRVSQTNSSVLIYGETGTGKELVAQAIHSHSDRNGECLISQNCAAIPHTLLEGLFFGTTKGSYTGAEDKPGILELADKGTIFLDEINSMDINMQTKLLRAIEEKVVTRIGDSKPKKIDVRIIAAMNEKPEDSIKENKFREDLFYRLSSIQIEVPPLRHRKSDIISLTKHFISYYNKEMNVHIDEVSEEVFKAFQNYHWPGNVREFKNVIESCFNFASSNIINIENLPESILKVQENLNPTSSYEGDSLNDAMESYEKNYIIHQSKGVKTLTELADKLKISRQTLNYKIKKYDLGSLIRLSGFIK